tara:strand:- start:36 stop:6599 length:6564 start_codon:yes stop_codon:yes gene_type:complete
MKFRDVKTLEHLLKEYGAQSGAPEYNTGQSGMLAKAKQFGNKIKKAHDDGKAIATGKGPDVFGQSGSPTTTQNTSPNMTGKGKKPTGPAGAPGKRVKASDINVGTPFRNVIKNKTGFGVDPNDEVEDRGEKVVGKITTGDMSGSVVAQDKTGKTEIYHPDMELEVDEDIGHDILKKVTKQKTSKKNSIARKIKKLSRSRLKEGEFLAEINFNKKEIINNALDLPVRCGFEAETVFTEAYGGSGQDIDDLSWQEVQDELYVSNRDNDYVEEGFGDWIRENKVPDYFDDVMERFVENEREEDESYVRFLESDGPSMDAVQEYKDNMKDEDPTEYENREEDGWEMINWVREYVDEEYEQEYLDWLREYLDEDGEVFQEAYDEALSDHSIDEWINEEYYSMSSFCDDYGIDYSELRGGGLDEVANQLNNWTEESSKFKDYPETGDYGDTSTDGWAVETDSSIDADSGSGAEIISPVYETPREMLEEMRSLFAFFDRSSVETNASTGLHVTMSWGGLNPKLKQEPNKLKMASLLGDEYLLSTFGRLKNSYTKSQSQRIKKAASKLRTDIKSREEIENALQDAISGDKFSSINFKSIKDHQTSTNLVEFRISGGVDYHKDMSKVVKAVIRYATVMESGYTEEYDNDYVNALYRIIHTAGRVDPKDIEQAKDRFDIDNIQEPVVNLFITMLSKGNYLDGLRAIVNAYELLDNYAELNDPDADEKWEQSVKDYEEATGNKVNIDEVEAREPIRAYAQPDRIKPSIKKVQVLDDAQSKYLEAMGTLAVDIAEGKSRTPLNAKSVGLARKSIKDFMLTPEEFSTKILRASSNLNISTQNSRADQKMVVLKRGIDALFKKDFIVTPNFLNTPTAEKIVKGVWNALHSTDINKQQKDDIVELLIKLNYGEDVNMKSDGPHNMRVSIQTIFDQREFNEFYSYMVRTGYNNTNPPAEPGEQYDKDMYEKLISYTNKFPEYNEPVAPHYNNNFYSDDSYIDNYLNTYVMKLRKRFLHFSELKDGNLQFYYDSLPILGKITENLLRECKASDGYYLIDAYPKLDQTVLADQKDGNLFLAIDEYSTERLQGMLDRIAKKDYSDPFDGDVAQQLGERLTEVIRNMLGQYYKKKEEYPEYYKIPPMDDLVKKRFAGIKSWMSEFDQLAQKMGFDSQAEEIAGKKDIENREKGFNQSIQERPPISLDIPKGAVAFIRSKLFRDITDEDVQDIQRRKNQMAQRQEFTTKLNSGGDVYVIPKLHREQAEEADSIEDTLNSIKGTPLADSQEWRRKIAQTIRKKFLLKYRTSYKALEYEQEFTFIGISERNQLLTAGVEVVVNTEQKEVMPLVPAEQMQKPDGTPFDRKQAAAQDVTSDTIQNSLNNELIKAAGLTDPTMQEMSSHALGNFTDWTSLAQAVDIDLGVNDQGTKLFKKVYDQFDSQPSSEREGIGLERWLLAVQDAIKYIKKNYKVSGGNYFRTDADGNVGDDVSDVYSIPHYTSNSAYDKARADHPGFDRMMQRGMQNYLARGDVNKLVGFLNNPDNNNVFKSQVLNTITNRGDMENGPFASFQDALAVTRRQGNESVFSKFSELPLQEQIAKLENIDISKINQLHEKALGRAELKTPQRIQTFADKLKAGEEFTLAGGEGSIKLDPSMADAFDNAENAGQLPAKLTTADGELVSYNTLEKTAEFGARSGGPAGDDAPVKVSNKGEVAEGILGCGTFARLLVRPSAPVTSADIENVIKQLPTDAPDQGGWHELTLTAQEVDNPIADFFTLTLNLKSDTYQDFIDPQKWNVMQNISSGVVDYVNDNLEKYTNYFQANGKVDAVKVIADGVSGETDTKVDVFLTHSLDGGPEKTLQHFDMSVKVGSTKQMGQVGGGKQSEPLSVRYSILAEMWQKFDVDISNIEQDFLNSESVEQGYKIAYTEAVRQLNSHLTSEEKEKDFLITLLNAIKFFATLNDDRVKLVQFTDLKAGGYYVLDFKKLDRMMNKDRVDLEAKMIETAKHPKITIFNKVTNKDFLSIRMYQAGSGYIRNYIEKEKGLVDLTKVRGSGMRKKVESVQEDSSHGVSFANEKKIPAMIKAAGKLFGKKLSDVDVQRQLQQQFGVQAYEARHVISKYKELNSVKEGAVPNNDTIRKLKEIFAKPLLANDIKAQMNAYICIPDPSMIRDFRAARASYGDNHDLRTIVKSYAKIKLHDTLKKKLSK